MSKIMYKDKQYAGCYEPRIGVRQVSIALPSAVTIAVNGLETVFTNYDVTHLIGEGNTLVGATFNWANGSRVFAGNLQVNSSDNTIFLTLTNTASGAMTVSTVVLTLFYQVN